MMRNKWAIAVLLFAIVAVVMLWFINAHREKHHPGQSFILDGCVLPFSMKTRTGEIRLDAVQTRDLLWDVKVVAPAGVNISNLQLGVLTGPQGSALNLKCSVSLSTNIAPGKKRLCLYLPGLVSVASYNRAALTFPNGYHAFDGTNTWIVTILDVEPNHSMTHGQ